MLKSKANWTFANEDESSAEELLQMNDISPLIAKLLYKRNIQTKEEALEFLKPDIENLVDPKKFAMIDKASERVMQAIENDEKILVYGDYDADGVSSTALILKTLQELQANCNYYIPNRFTEGYGLHEQAIRKAKERGYSLIITVDTGINAVFEAEFAIECGIDLIITDHHEVQDELPDAYAIIHPHISPDYPFKDLAGVGVAFKFAQFLLGYFPKHLLDLVALGTLADLVPLVNENRILTYFGLRELEITNNQGLIALKRQCQIEGSVTETHIGFSLGPRINAVGRLQDADLAVELLMTKDPTIAKDLANTIEKINEKRQQLVVQIAKEAEELIDHRYSVIIVAQEGWNEGVLGIVASRLTDKYDKPSIVLSINEATHEAKGSGRSIPSFNLFLNCMKMRQYFTHFGGHAQAAGMTIPTENIQYLQQFLHEQINEQLTEDEFKKIITVDESIEVDEINESLIQEINQLAPFGTNNSEPIFCIKGNATDFRQIGALKNHLKFKLKQQYSQSEVECIGFKFGDVHHHLTESTEIQVVGHLEINEWNNIRKPQILMKDIRIQGWQLFDFRGKKDVHMVPYLTQNTSNAMLGETPFNYDKITDCGVEQLSYKMDEDHISEADALYIFQLPKHLKDLQTIVENVKPNNIYACYDINNSAYLSFLPTREDFAWLYSLLYKNKQVNIPQLQSYIKNVKGWETEQVNFMIQVFKDLDFITIENETIHIQKSPVKKDLQTSKTYYERVNQVQIERTMYYSTYEELKKWFATIMGQNRDTEEEALDGLQTTY